MRTPRPSQIDSFARWTTQMGAKTPGASFAFRRKSGRPASSRSSPSTPTRSWLPSDALLPISNACEAMGWSPDHRR